MRSNRDADPRQQGNRRSNDAESYLSMFAAVFVQGLTHLEEVGPQTAQTTAPRETLILC